MVMCLRWNASGGSAFIAFLFAKAKGKAIRFSFVRERASGRSDVSFGSVNKPSINEQWYDIVLIEMGGMADVFLIPVHSQLASAAAFP